MRLLAFVATLLPTLALACTAAPEEGDEPDALGASADAVVRSGVGGPCGVSRRYQCRSGLVCQNFRCADPAPPPPAVCPEGQIMSNGYCIPDPAVGGGGGGGGVAGGPCQVTIAYVFYSNTARTVGLPLSQADCGALTTSMGTPRVLSSAPGTGLSELINPVDYGTDGLLFKGYAPAISYDGAQVILTARDSFIAATGQGFGGFAQSVTLTGVYQP